MNQIAPPFVDGEAVNIVKWWGRFLRPVSDGLASLTDDTGWEDLVLVNGWTNYGSTYQDAQIRRRGDIVSVRGLVKNANTTATRDAIAYLPAKYLPSGIEIFICRAAGAAGGNTGRVDVRNGSLELWEWGATGNAGYVSLETITYSAR